MVPDGFNNSNLGMIKEKGILYDDLASGPAPFPRVLILSGNLVDASVGSHCDDPLFTPKPVSAVSILI